MTDDLMTDSRLANLVLEKIAGNQLGMETLSTRGSDDLDFHEVAVWGVRDSLLMATEVHRAIEAAHAELNGDIDLHMSILGEMRISNELAGRLYVIAAHVVGNQ